MTRTRFVAVLTLVLLLTGTVAVFLAIDRSSHSASDTLRPFVVVMAPLWLLATTLPRLLLRPRSGPGN